MEQLELSPFEQRQFVELALSVNEITSTDGYRDWVRSRIRPIFPHETMISAIGNVVGKQITVDCLIGVDYPQEFIDRISLNSDLSERYVIARWFRDRSPQLINAEVDYDQLSETELREVKNFGLRNIAAYGLIDLEGRKGTYFSFSRVPGLLTIRHGKVLELITPYLHQALISAMKDGKNSGANASQSLAALSVREREVLAWMIAGKTNREIAAALRRSEPTIRNQVHAILAKLEVPNRTQAVSKAVSLGFGAFPGKR